MKTHLLRLAVLALAPAAMLTIAACSPSIKDVKRHKATFQLADGTTKTVKAGKKVDVTILKVGDSVSMQVGQGLLITADKAA